MNSRNKILAAIRDAKPAPAELPVIPDFLPQAQDVLALFQKMVEMGSGKVYDISTFGHYNQIVEQLFPQAKRIASAVPGIPGNYDLSTVAAPIDLKSIDVAIINGQIGVAENGAIWVTENESIHRVLPFITQHLILILNKKNIIWNMHEAYRQIQIDATGFGIFIAGPSKTADIEQSLVIGAQGARSLSVLLV